MNNYTNIIYKGNPFTDLTAEIGNYKAVLTCRGIFGYDYVLTKYDEVVVKGRAKCRDIAKRLIKDLIKSGAVSS